MKIYVKYHGKDFVPIRAIRQGDWLDLRSAEEVVLRAGEFRLISLGVSMQLPQGYEAHVAPRSSTFQTWGILQTNGVGIIDESYCGDGDIWKMPVYATRDTVIHVNDRICQFRILPKMPPVELESCDHLAAPNRGGFGSTGRG